MLFEELKKQQRPNVDPENYFVRLACCFCDDINTLHYSISHLWSFKLGLFAVFPLSFMSPFLLRTIFILLFSLQTHSFVSSVDHYPSNERTVPHKVRGSVLPPDVELTRAFANTTSPHWSWGQENYHYCEWLGVLCDESQHVVELLVYYLEGEICWPFLPHTLLRLTVRSGSKVTGVVPFEALPHELTHLELGVNFLSGPVPTRYLPRYLETCYLLKNRFSGIFDATSLPALLVDVDVSHNEFSGLLILTSLPPQLGHLNVEQNQFHGTIDLSQLPAYLHEINLSHNRFSGPIGLGSLPENLHWIRLKNNTFNGNLSLSALPEGFRVLDASENLFEGFSPQHLPGYEISCRKQRLRIRKLKQRKSLMAHRKRGHRW